MKLQVVVAAMNQSDLSLFSLANIKADMLICNQTDNTSYKKSDVNGFSVELVNTETKGVGINRNLGIMYSTGDVLLFSDDDIVYYDGVANKIIGEFEKYPDTDAIIFGIELTKNDQVYKTIRFKDKKAYLFNSLIAGTSMLAIRRSAVVKNNLSFSLLFGGGAKYSCGEDTIFIVDAFKAKLKFRKSSLIIGKTASDSSSWFRGYDEKYYKDKGALLACSFPILCYLFVPYFAKGDVKKTKQSFVNAIRLMYKGVAEFKRRN